MLLLKLIGIWMVLAVAGFLNGVLRGLALTPVMGDQRARQVSSVTASVLIFLVVFGFGRVLRGLGGGSLLGVGILWTGLTIAFEFTLGRVAGKPWHEIFEDYNVLNGRLWVLVLATVLLAPLVVGELRGNR